MNTIELLNSTPESRQIWYWRRECEETIKHLGELSKEHPDREKWLNQYNNAKKTLEQLTNEC